MDRFGCADPSLWNFGSASLDQLTYNIFHCYPSMRALDDSGNAQFVEGATWYLGEIVRRSNPRTLRWTESIFEYSGGRFIVQPTAKTRAAEYVSPQASLRNVAMSGDPLTLPRTYRPYIDTANRPSWQFSPSDIYQRGTGVWTWDSATERWLSTRDLWRNGIAELLAVLAPRLPGIALDYSPASLAAVEQFACTDAVATDPALRSAVIAYLGESLLRTGDGRWIWDDHPGSITYGYPLVKPYLGAAVSPAHVLEYARTWPDGRNFARLHEAWSAAVEGYRDRNLLHLLTRESTPGIDGPDPVAPGEAWAGLQRARFPEWIERFGAGYAWDFSEQSMDSLAELILRHCPTGSAILDSGAPTEFLEGAVWYLGETLHRARPSRWVLTDFEAPRLARLSIMGYASEVHPLGEFLIQTLDGVVRPTRIWYGPSAPASHPESLRYTYNLWRTGEMRWRIDESVKRRERTKRKRARRGVDDADVLADWLAERQAAFPGWVQRYGAQLRWDFSPATLDDLEGVIWSQAVAPEELLLDPAREDFLLGAAWYLGEVVRRQRNSARWTYQRDFAPEPSVEWMNPGPGVVLAGVYTDLDRRGGILQGWYRSRLETLARYAETDDVES
ncbi:MULTISPECIES: hypothetical protein [Mycobacterium]|uniref:hypothetical protein n=1 Tax=Mycobacterium TaxID=1763 RepID=UPI001EF0D1F4|nr:MULTISPECIES: hypothetical protein [Mycobacterium]BDB39818.1 hypothetical protein IWGMT90018_02640 [Mycobacterium kiyosense]